MTFSKAHVVLVKYGAATKGCEGFLKTVDPIGRGILIRLTKARVHNNEMARGYSVHWREHRCLTLATYIKEKSL